MWRHASTGRRLDLLGRARHLAPAALLYFLAAAASAFQGQVVFQGTGSPVAGAEVSILGSNAVRRTDSNGTFTWDPSPAPPFEVLVVLPGGRYMKPVRVEKIPATGPVIIEVLPLAEESVTVTAGAAPTIASTPGSGTTLVPRAEIEARQPANLAQVLENVAGATAVSEGQAAVPALRGLARGRTLILVDGARVVSERRVGPSATTLDPFVLDAVEVSRGPGSVAYGSDAFGGVIAARTRAIEPGGPLRLRAMGDFGLGTPGGRAGAEVSGKLGAEGGFLVLGHWREHGAWESPEGEVFNSGFRDSGVLLRAGHRLGPGLLTAGFQGDYGEAIERPRNNSRTVRFFYPQEDSERFTLSYDLDAVAGFARTGLTAFFGSTAQITDQDRFATPTAPRSVERADVSANDFQVRGFAERFFGPVRVEAGLDVHGRFGLRALDVSVVYGSPVVENVNVSVEDARRTDVGGYLTAETALLPRLSVAAGARGDRVTTRNVGGYFGDRSSATGDYSGFLSLTAGTLGGFSATAQVARGFRDPVLSDRYFRGPSGRGFITGNPDLEPETSFQLDLALRHAGPGYRLAVYGYQYRIADSIERFQTQPDFFFFRNRGKARLRGLELEAQAELGAGFSLGLAAQLERGETLDDDLPLDDVPPPSVSLQARKSLGRAFAQIRGVAFDRDNRPGPTEQARPGYALFDVGGGFRPTEWLELQVYIRNVLDQKYLVSPDARAVLAPGISAAFTAFVRL